MMTVEMMAKLRRSLIKHEGFENFPYSDTVGKLSIGIGYNLSDRGLSDEWINSQYQQDVDYFHKQLSTFPWFEKLNNDRQIVLVDMCFMGFKKLLSFKKMIRQLESGDYDFAAEEMLDSKWAQQVGERAKTLAKAMRTGVYNI
jgi:lysozyme